MNRISRRTMAVAIAGAVALGGASTLVLGNPAQAATDTFTFYGETNGRLAPPITYTDKSVALTVSPTAAAPGSPIEIKVSSSNFAIASGPVAQSAANGTELDAIVGLNGQDYLLRGPIATVASQKNANVIDPGWTISSSAGNSIGTTTHAACSGAGQCGIGGPTTLPAANAVPATAGLGNAVINKSVSPPFSFYDGTGSLSVGSNLGVLSAPSVTGSYGITLKALVQNAVAGSSTPGLDDTYDNFFNRSSTYVADSYFADTASSFFAFSSPVSLNVLTADLVVTSITGQRPGVTQYVRAGDKINVAGVAWGANQSSLSVQICAAAGVPCYAPLANTLSTNANGDLSGQIPITAGPSGNAAIKVTGVGGSKLIQITNLADRSVVVSPASGAPGTIATVSGTGYDSNAAVSVSGLQGVSAGIPTFSTDAAVSTTAAADGTWSTSYTINDPLTTLVGGVETPPFGNPATDGATTGFAVLAPPAVNHTAYDFDGDGKADRAVFRNGKWIIGQSSTNTQVVGYTGTLGDVPVAGDFDGDGTTDRAVFRNGKWIITESSTNAQVVGYTGSAGDVPTAGDFDGDGKADRAVFRNGKWIINQSSTNTQVVGYTGTAGDIPALGDFDGDGKADRAVVRNGKWIINPSSTNVQVSGYTGTAGDIPVAADYDGDGKTDRAVFRNGKWIINESSTNVQVVGYTGLGTDTPVPASSSGGVVIQ